MNSSVASVSIIDYTPAHAILFRELNQAWIERYFEMEELDHKSLGNPDGYIIAKGGHILMAEHNGEIVGTCALIKVDDQTYELAKMAVTDKAQGLKIGKRLGEAAIQKARELGCTSLFLLSNRKLETAIHLYRKLGFIEVPDDFKEYKRADIKMELSL
ncbi:MarR family transcriptional regulator [Rufibacter radiotolerans]|uniref:MarR family transcriptional regulator n=1 Tax=Rufibacter radiotolerans TaxID=1379910 RepID=A0A0H4W8Y6_9BACT|nr:GNAT family N-acetyltransferase [Rufibacter radiotolerans]AKQ46916.1 MarR family transcriptional regulator [Rufibacter radiotolerans]